MFGREIVRFPNGRRAGRKVRTAFCDRSSPISNRPPGWRGCHRAATKNKHDSRNRPGEDRHQALPGGVRHWLIADRFRRWPRVNSRMVGARSIKWLGLSVQFAAAKCWLGHWTMSGVLMPPSWDPAICANETAYWRRSTNRARAERNAPGRTRLERSGSRLSPRMIYRAGPVVGKEEKSPCCPARPFLSWATTRPISVSMRWTMAACKRHFDRLEGYSPRSVKLFHGTRCSALPGPIFSRNTASGKFHDGKTSAASKEREHRSGPS